MHLNNIEEGRELKILGPQSGQALIWNGYCRKKEEGEGRVQHKVGKTFGTLLLQSFQQQCQQYFSLNSQALLAQIYLFTWFIVHAHTNLSMHWHKIFQHSYTFVRQHSISWRKKKAIYILQRWFHTCNWCKNLFVLFIMTSISKNCTWVSVWTLPLPTRSTILSLLFILYLTVAFPLVLIILDMSGCLLSSLLLSWDLWL